MIIRNDNIGFVYLQILHHNNMVGDNFCHCGSCGHEKIDECYTKQCGCCLTDHQGPFDKNR